MRSVLRHPLLKVVGAVFRYGTVLTDGNREGGLGATCPKQGSWVTIRRYIMLFVVRLVTFLRV
jgi:hypothetical protein